MQSETKICLSVFQTSMNAKTILAITASRHVTTPLEAIGATVQKVTRIWRGMSRSV